jgi:HNH endonuclease
MRAEGMKLQAIADVFGVSRAAVSLALSRKTSRINKIRALKPCACGCGRLHARLKYASTACYFTHTMKLAAGDTRYVNWRYGSKIARRLVLRWFPLEKEHVVHHADRNDRNNALANLWVFASNGEHTSFHRGGAGRPIWRGDFQPLG